MVIADQVFPSYSAAASVSSAPLALTAAVCGPPPEVVPLATGNAPPLAHAPAVITLVDLLNYSVAPVEATPPLVDPPEINPAELEGELPVMPTYPLAVVNVAGDVAQEDPS